MVSDVPTKIRNDEPNPHLNFQENSRHLKASTDFALSIPLQRNSNVQIGINAW